MSDDWIIQHHPHVSSPGRNHRAPEVHVLQQLLMRLLRREVAVAPGDHTAIAADRREGMLRRLDLLHVKEPEEGPVVSRSGLVWQSRGKGAEGQGGVEVGTCVN